MVFATDDERRCNLNTVLTQTGQSLGSLLKQAFVAREAQKLFWKTCARQRPQARTRTAAKDDRSDLNHDSQIYFCSVTQVHFLLGLTSKKEMGEHQW